MRNMTVEYLRVIFIFLIVLLHILWKDYGGIYLMPSNQSTEAYIQLGLTNLTSIGVTGFILISGYYGVKLKISRILFLWIQTTTYALASVLVISIFFGGSFIKKTVDAPLMLFDGGWWFVTDYLVLMLLSPFLNAGLDILNKRQLLFIIWVISFIMYGAEWFHAKDASMPLLLFFNTYLVGRFIKLYPINFVLKFKYPIFIIGLSLLIVEPMILHAIGLDGKMKFVSGNFNVLVLITDISLLQICLSHQKNGKGNFLTRNVLAIYLIHESEIGRRILHENIFYDGRTIDFVFILAIVVFVVVASVLIEEVRRWLFGSFEKVCVAKVESIFNLDKK